MAVALTAVRKIATSWVRILLPVVSKKIIELVWGWTMHEQFWLLSWSEKKFPNSCLCVSLSIVSNFRKISKANKSIIDCPHIKAFNPRVEVLAAVLLEWANLIIYFGNFWSKNSPIFIRQKCWEFVNLNCLQIRFAFGDSFAWIGLIFSLIPFPPPLPRMPTNARIQWILHWERWSQLETNTYNSKFLYRCFCD